MRKATHLRLAKLEARRRPAVGPVAQQEIDALVAAILADPEWAEQFSPELIGEPGPHAVAAVRTTMRADT